MTYSCSDLADDVVGHLLALNLITRNDLDDADPQTQATLCVNTISNLSNSVTVLHGLLHAIIGEPSAPDSSAPAVVQSSTKTINPALAQRVHQILGAAAIQPAVQGPAARFMAELLGESGTLTDIADEHGNRTLADCMYLLSAIQKGTYIEHVEPSPSRVLDVVQQLPSRRHWMKFIVQVPQ